MDALPVSQLTRTFREGLFRGWQGLEDRIMNTTHLTIPTPQQDPLDAEDFRRLGVRPNEYRLGIIRNAAVRSARPLADRQLHHPNEKTVRQLSRVVSSAYRLMDPRRRQNSAQRAYVGRILPQALRVAGRTKFASEIQELGDQQLLSDRQQTALVTEVNLHENAQNNGTDSRNFGWDFALGNRAGPPGEIASDEAIWQTTLRDEDLVSMTPATRKLRHVRRRIQKRWIAMVATGMTLGVVFGLLTMGNGKMPETSDSIESTQPVHSKPPAPTFVEVAMPNPRSSVPPVPDSVDPMGSVPDSPSGSYLPDPFLDQAADSDELFPQEPMQKPAAANSISVDQTELGLRGRLVIASSDEAAGAFKDAGVSLRYQPGIPITPTMLQAIQKHLRRPLVEATMTLRGVFEQELSSHFSFSVKQELDGVGQQLIIDGHPIELASSLADLSPGKHELEWRVVFLPSFSLENFVGPIQFSLEFAPSADPANWQPIRVFSKRSDRNGEEPSDLKIAILAPEQSD